MGGVAVKDSLAYLATSSNSLELQVASGGASVEPKLIDVSGDGLVTTSCLGDSNTQVVGSSLRYWCQVVDDLITRPNWRTRNRGAPFATVTPGWTSSALRAPTVVPGTRGGGPGAGRAYDLCTIAKGGSGPVFRRGPTT